MKNILGNGGLSNGKLADVLGNGDRVIEGATSSKDASSPIVNIYKGKSISGTFSFKVTVSSDLSFTFGLDFYATKIGYIFWGDGTATGFEGLGGLARTMEHTYTTPGTYRITIPNAGNVNAIAFSQAEAPKVSELRGEEFYKLINLQYLFVASVGISNWVITSTGSLPQTLLQLTLDTIPGVVWNISSLVPVPPQLAYLIIYGCPGITYNVNTYPLPATITKFSFRASGESSWTINSSSPVPAGITDLYFENAESLVIEDYTVFERPKLAHLSFANDYLVQSVVDNILKTMSDFKASYTSSSPSVSLANCSKPSGTFRSASPPTTGQEYKYNLMMGSYVSAGPEWSVSTGTTVIT